VEFVVVELIDGMGGILGSKGKENAEKYYEVYRLSQSWSWHILNERYINRLS